ncbi:MAG: calcium/sodium antiporter [Spirochaetes bacterium]|nr:calcium/sodium antiporter [Spirochaetota bacterium]
MEIINQFFNNLPTILNFAFFIGGLYALIKGSDLFVESAVFFAKKFRVSEVIIGLTLVSIGTSLPELATNINSALKGRTAIAIGNVTGSNITNIALVAGVAIIMLGTIRFDKKLLTRDMLFMIGTTVLLVIFSYFFDGKNYAINRIEAGIMLAFLVLYLYYLFKFEHVEEEAEEHHIKSMTIAILFFLIGFVGIFIGSELMVQNVIVIAKRLSIPDGVIGATIVALGTSLPELSVTITSILKKRSDLSLGNIVGSNIFNILGILGITGIIRNINIFDKLTNTPDTMTLFFTIPLALFIALLFLIFMRTRWELNRIEGIVLLLCYFCFIALSFIGLPV